MAAAARTLQSREPIASVVAAVGGVDVPTRPYGTAPAAAVPLAPGALLPGTRYRLLGWLGDGGMGVVYEAEQIDLGRRVALKVLRNDPTQPTRDAERVAMFRAEARTVASIRSEFIVDVYDFAELPDGRVMFAMELLRGVTLRNALVDGPLPVARALGILRQVCKGLAAAHAAGVVHRDIKPENVHLGRRGDRSDAVRLLDFGVATIMRDGGSRARVAGTPWYFAPELVTGMPHDGRVDLYALGCTAFEMLVGRRPFDGDEHEVVLSHLGEDPPRFASLLPPTRELAAIEPVVRRCLEKDPRKRFASAAELEAALCDVQIELGLTTAWDDLPLPQVELGWRERLAAGMPDAGAFRESMRRVRRRRRWLASAAIAAVLAAITIATWPTQGARAELDALEAGAHEAAAQAYFVYPPPDDPHRATAFDFVLQLEAVPGVAGLEASQRARALRAEFAATLVRLGDRYWDLDGGMPFAIDYYACALMFQPEHEHARVRAALTPGEVSALRAKAGSHSFSAAELAAASPLLALAEDDEGERNARLAALDTHLHGSISTRVALDRLAADTPATAPRKAARGTRHGGTAKPATPPAGEPAPVVDDTVAAPADDVDAVVDDVTAVADAIAPAPAAAPTIATAPAPTRPRPSRAAALAAAREAMTRGELESARRSFEAVLSLDHDDVDGLAGLARVEFERGRHARAAKLAARAVAASPQDAGLRMLLGDALFRSFRYEDARAQYQRAAELGHKSAAGRLAKVDAALAH
ncbi:MAG: tetratricopeptide repeat protein [Nannocystaceae bacterium]|nr:tetratricopeptide repeat protein [Nannocystaceae bacterium]